MAQSYQPYDEGSMEWSRDFCSIKVDVVASRFTPWLLSPESAGVLLEFCSLSLHRT